MTDIPPPAPPWGPRIGQERPRSDSHAPALPKAGPSAEENEPDALKTIFAGRRVRLFWLALRTGLLTVLTLGLYRFWQKTRLRRWYWSAIRPGGLPLEYVGDPFEKLLGFLIAVCFLAFYIGVVNLLLMFASFSLFQENTFAYGLSFVGLVPLWFYAQYRARRYVLARTRWRGLRFGQAPGAWGYAMRAMGHWLVTILSLGLLWPRMTFALEKYRTDRTYYGNCRMEQGGRWTMLYPATRWIAAAGGIGLASIVAAGSGAIAAAGWLGGLAALILPYGLVHYRVETLRRLTNQKRLGRVRLVMDPHSGKVFLTLVWGYLLALVAVALPAGVLGLILLGVQSAETVEDLGLAQVSLAGLDRWVLVGLGVAIYFLIFLIWCALTHALVTMPILRHYAETLRIVDARHLDRIRQRPRDRHTEAEGFAEALDVGASI